MIKAEILWDLQEFRTLEKEWNDLFDIGHSEPSTSLEWTNALIETHVSGADIVFVVILRQADRIVSIAPAIIRREKVIGPLSAATLSFLSELYNTHSDILWASDQPEIVAALFDAFASLPCRWDIFRASRVLESRQLTQNIVDVLSRSNLACRIRREQPSLFLELDRSYDEFLRSRSGKFRNYLKRKSRQLDGLGQVRVRRAGRDLSLDEAYRDLLAVDERSWKHAHGTAISAIPSQRSFYRLLCEGALRRGRLHLMLMYLNDRPIAFNLGLTVLDRYCYIKTSFDDEFRRVSPATVLRARVIEMLIDEGFRGLDFAGEPYQWEEQWTNQMRWHRSILAFNTTPMAFLYRVAVWARDALRRGTGGNGVRYVDPRTLRAQ